jgi:serine/threonine-protein kinase
MPETLRIGQGGSAGGVGRDDDETYVHEGSKKLRPPRARRCPTCAQAFSGEARFCPFDGDPLVDAPDWNPSADALLGETVDGRYEVLRVLGEGGMGIVYEVRHKLLDRRFAMKVLRRDVLADQDHSERFTREAKAAASIGHPNIVAVTDFGELPPDKLAASGRARVPYFVMELLEGQALSALLKVEHVLEPRRGAALLAQCASALDAAHRAGVLHRDLKPDNVFLVSSGGRETVKLLDFGVAKIAGAGRLTRAGRVFGTPHYMSPEQAQGREIDERADIYALGVILYECFAGRRPFEADTYMGVLTQHMFAAPAPLERVAPNPDHLGALAPIVMRCLEKQPDDRFATAADVARALEAAASDPDDVPPPAPRGPGHTLRLREAEPLDDAPASVPLPTIRILPARRVLAALGALALCAAVIAAASSLRGPRERALVARPAPLDELGALLAQALAEARAAPPPAPVASLAVVEAPPAPPPAPRPRPAPRAAAAATAPAGPKRSETRRAGELVDPWAE